MPNQHSISSLGAFIKALHEEDIDCILIGMMAAVVQGAAGSTVDYDLWVRLPERQYVRILTIVRRLGGTILARTMYELKDGTQVNAIFRPDGLESFVREYKRCLVARIDRQPIRILPLDRVIASKRASNREKDLAMIPILERALRRTRKSKTRTK